MRNAGPTFLGVGPAFSFLRGRPLKGDGLDELLLHIGIICVYRILPHPIFRVGVFCQLEGADTKTVDTVIAVMGMHFAEVPALVSSAVRDAGDPEFFILHLE
jgi:hypothetical protein